MRIKFYITFFILFHANLLYAQKYNIQSNIGSSIIQKLKANLDPYDFMEYGYLINSYNIAYEKTGDIKFLNRSYYIVKAIEEMGKQYNNQFKSEVSKNKKLKDGTQYSVYEGYYFQYAAEFFFILKKNDLLSKFPDVSVKFIEENFLKWYNLSIKSNGDFGLLLKSRRHMGAQWATTALYLSNLCNTNCKYYLDFLKYYNEDLRSGLKIMENGGYYWEANYSSVDRNKIALNSNNKNRVVAQDVSHANHIVNYILTAYKLNYGNWNKIDITRLIITLKSSINDFDKGKFSDNIDGSQSFENGLKGRGWKQTDGWMKLVDYDEGLRLSYQKFYRQNYRFFKNSIFNIQFEAIML